MDILWPKIIGLLLLPPGGVLIIALLGLLLYIKWTWAGIIFLLISTMLLMILSLPHTGALLLAGLESYAPPLPATSMEEREGSPGAIVVLGGGRYADAPEYGQDTVSTPTLERLRYAVHLQRAVQLPILVSGGSVYDEPKAEAELMQTALMDNFNMQARWVETSSRTTLESAIHSKKQLTEAGITHVYLVTHAAHMRRAAWTYQQAGLEITPAPTGFTTLTRGERGVLGYFPSSKGLQMSSQAFYERLGLLWYKLSRNAAEPDAPSAPLPTPAG